MPSEITDAMVERAVIQALAWRPSEDGPSYNQTMTAVLEQIKAASAARPAPEAGSVVEKLRRRAETYNTGTPVNPAATSTMGYYSAHDSGLDREAADLIQSQASERNELRAALQAIMSNHETAGAGASIFQCTTAEVNAARRALTHTTGQEDL